MPEKATMEAAKEDLREGKSPSTAAGEFVREEMDHIREGKHGASSAKQAIAIGLSKARRAGIPLGQPLAETTSAATRHKAAQDTERGKTDPATGEEGQTKRGRAREKAMKREPRAAASHRALSRQAKGAARKRTSAERSASAKKAAATRKREGSSGRSR
ncbi:MAG TPA: DNA-binding protein [Acidobacteriaceae bacterium]